MIEMSPIPHFICAFSRFLGSFGTATPFRAGAFERTSTRPGHTHPPVLPSRTKVGRKRHKECRRRCNAARHSWNGRNFNQIKQSQPDSMQTERKSKENEEQR